MASRFDVFVVGAGVAGLTAAEEFARLGLAVGIAEELMFGGLVLNVNQLAPGLPGHPESGSDLAAEAMTRIADMGVNTVFESVVSIETRLGDGYVLATASEAYTARFVIVASGARLRKLGVRGEAEFEHRGVSHCADCDAPLYRNEPAVVVGGGDSALQAAELLARFCSAVHLVHRGEGFSGSADFAAGVRGNPRINIHMRTVVEAIGGTQQVESVDVRNLDTGATSRLPCSGFFAYVGLEPNTTCLPAGVELLDGHVRVNERLETTLPGVYAVGAVRQGFGGRLTHAAIDAKSVVSAIRERLALAA